MSIPTGLNAMETATIVSLTLEEMHAILTDPQSPFYGDHRRLIEGVTDALQWMERLDIRMLEEGCTLLTGVEERGEEQPSSTKPEL